MPKMLHEGITCPTLQIRKAQGIRPVTGLRETQLWWAFESGYRLPDWVHGIQAFQEQDSASVCQ